MTVGLVAAVVFLGAQILLRFFFEHKSRIFRTLFWLSVIVIFAIQAYWMREQFLAWHGGGPPASYLVPPYRGFSYFALYSFTNFLIQPFLAFFAALFVLLGAKFLNRKFQDRFFEKEEPYIAAGALFLAGHPGWMYALAAVLSIYLIIHTSLFIIHKQQKRIPLYWLWLPISISVIIFSGLGFNFQF
ncbi:hypothetical protein A3A20_01345 [Candidatus Wolfebacteria bacterium RIFCSPLOWO2_01_FULL_45_19]|uniref:Uncharacterized protein n=1 Tax=Candidatus Wolfebacteria bacterium RIFCSPLOWO2_01_FULL_45_19 TaxID=1802557 RepID=A0A1F8DSY3_9BACT|nr:MAG: hypothetical protein UX23_C0004G0047 [Parcubacteria group bacterium GW2011_GWB1_45_9]OGM91572.1 MAG: hypothetical protein A3A20_01345 [Candidatus Wolfebacteria bacterium RIFCSPLOWO2_01_FULL_45_19]